MNNKISISKNEYLPLREIVFNNLKDAIINGQFKTGERLLENELANQLGVSRTPIREALRKLEHEGLVIMIPRKGAQVSGLSEKDVHDVLEIRAVLEALSAKLACINISDDELIELEQINNYFQAAANDNDIKLMKKYDEEFHSFIFRASKNKKLEEILSELKTQIYRYRITYLKDKKSIENIAREHNDLFYFIKIKDIEKASKCAYEQIKLQEEKVLEISKSNEK